MELTTPCPTNDLQSMSPDMSFSQDKLEILEQNWDEKGFEPILGQKKSPSFSKFPGSKPPGLKPDIHKVPEQSYYHMESFPNQAFEELQSDRRLVSEKEFIEYKINSLPQLVEIFSEELSMPVGARLAKFWKRWRKLGANSHVVRRLRFGLTLDWIQGPPRLSVTPLVISFIANKAKMALMRDHVKEMMDKGAVKIITDASPGFFSRVFMVPKQGLNKWRPVIDLSSLNRFLVKKTFRMETPELIRQSFTKDEWVTSIDLSDAYFHVPVAMNYRKYMRFCMDDTIYEFIAMPFGLSTAPREFTELVVEFKQIAFSRGFYLNQYLDDWINRDLNELIANHSIWNLLQLVIFLGFLPNYGKSSLIPSRQFDFLGGSYDLHTEQVRPTEKRVEKIIASTSSFQNSETKTVRQFMSLIGLLNATINQVSKMGRMHIRPIQWHLGRHWSEGQGYEKRIPVPESIKCHFGWWGCIDHLTSGVPLHKVQSQIQVITDSSEFGWGAHCQGQQIQGIWDQVDVRFHINVKELKTVLIAMRHFRDLVRDKSILVLCDNSTAVSYIEKQGGLKSHELYKTTFLIYSLAETLNVDLQVRHIAGSLNVVADRLSRQGKAITTEWSLHPVAFSTICETLGTPNIDLFATEENAKLPVYVSPVPDVKAYAIDALSFDWTDLDAYAYPPAALLTKILHKAKSQPCKLTLVAPFWCKFSWLWDLVHFSTDQPLRILPRPRLLAQPKGCSHKSGQRKFEDMGKLPFWNLHVWTLDFRSNIPHSQWWYEFSQRKLVSPEQFCLENDFTGSFPKKIAFWLDTGVIG